jgi:putative nucleotidyltransferase with HDIG domain
MDSVLCALLRTPRKRLGILHLARGPRQEPFAARDLQLADALAASVSAGIESAQLLRQQQEMFLNTITILAEAVEWRDKYTGGHVQRVTTYALLLAEHLGISREEQEIVRVGASLHDVGKIGIEDAVLRKTGQLTPQEREFMKSHTVYGDKLLSGIPQFAAVRPIVRSHHERWDGKGYPDGLKGMAIPHLARIVFVADAFDAMTSDRPYRRAMSPAAAFLELQAQSGKQFDPQCVAAFLAIRAKITEELNLGDGPRTQPKGMYEKGKEGG